MIQGFAFFILLAAFGNHAQAAVEPTYDAFEMVPLAGEADLSASAHIEEMSDQRFKLAGRGIVQKRSGNSLALVCVGSPTAEQPNEPNCDAYQFVFFAKDMKAYSVGPRFAFQSADAETRAEVQQIRTEPELKKYLKTLHRAALKKKRRVILIAAILTFMPTWGLSSAGIFGAGMMMSEATYMIGGFMVFPVATAFAAAAPQVLDPFTVVKSAAQGGASDTQILNQDGWSWSSEPKNAGRLYFNEFIKAIDPVAYGYLKYKYGKL